MTIQTPRPATQQSQGYGCCRPVESLQPAARLGFPQALGKRARPRPRVSHSTHSLCGNQVFEFLPRLFGNEIRIHQRLGCQGARPL